MPHVLSYLVGRRLHAKSEWGHHNQDLVDRLDRELTKMAIAQYDSDEFKLLFSTPLTLERARVNAILTVHYGINRRDCWAYARPLPL